MTSEQRREIMATLRPDQRRACLSLLKESLNRLRIDLAQALANEFQSLDTDRILANYKPDKPILNLVR